MSTLPHSEAKPCLAEMPQHLVFLWFPWARILWKLKRIRYLNTCHFLILNSTFWGVYLYLHVSSSYLSAFTVFLELSVLLLDYVLRTALRCSSDGCVSGFCWFQTIRREMNPWDCQGPRLNVLLRLGGKNKDNAWIMSFIILLIPLFFICQGAIPSLSCFIPRLDLKYIFPLCHSPYSMSRCSLPASLFCYCCQSSSLQRICSKKLLNPLPMEDLLWTFTCLLVPWSWSTSFAFYQLCYISVPFFLVFFFGRILDKSVLMKEGLALIYNFAGKIHYVGENTVMGEQRADRSHGTCSSGTREIWMQNPEVFGSFPSSVQTGMPVYVQVDLPSSPSTDEMTIN